ncbi:MAG: hypothetical protein EXR05_00120 [Acetobacteraceae bacterium]|nr:hypothetical protein [Acetobacteraceae bacterium]
MILSMDSRAAREMNRRKAKEGWNTLYMGVNRYHRKEGDATPDPDALYPVAFLVEKDPGAVIHPHYHAAEQFQVVVGGSCKFGSHDVDGVAVHYTGPYSSYGPIVAAEKGLQFFTLRKGFDAGAQYMPAERVGLREGRKQWKHREVTAGVPGVMSEAGLARLAIVEADNVLAQEADGVSAWRYRLPPGAALTGADPALGGGQFWLVLAGSLRVTDPEPLAPKSCVFVGADEAAPSVVAGPNGAEVLCMQFPRPTSH